MRQEVERLVSNDAYDGSLLERPLLKTAAIFGSVGSWAGREVGPYTVLSLIGAGGMGEVYRAHDNRLGRDVAIETLPLDFARDPERLARLRREARTLASLNHPNIAAIYGLEESAEFQCLVLELVEGERLCGPLSISATLDCATQLAEALRAAHEAGIIHRDLKPANVKLTPQGRVKVLDFGLAKAIWSGGSPSLLQPATMTGSGTLAGNIVGTPGYMSPEQTQGGEVDQRTDVWAFGCLVYELLSGKRAFAGQTAEEATKAVMEYEPDWRALPQGTPAKIRELLRQCLKKEPGRRLPSITVARDTIEAVRRGRNRWRIAAIASTAVAAAAVGCALWLGRSAVPPDRSQWVQLTKFPDPVSQPALSPDGRMLAFVRSPSTFYAVGQVFVKRLPDGDPVQLTNDNLRKMSPVFSPDGESLAYTAVDAKSHWDTWRVPARGGQPHPWLLNASGLIWTAAGRVLFSEIKEGAHMGIVAAGEDRTKARDLYLPPRSAAWRIALTLRRTASGCCWRKWIATGFPAAWCQPTAGLLAGR